MLEHEPIHSGNWVNWLIKACIFSLPTIAIAVIGMYVQLQQLVIIASSADKEISALKIEVSQLKKEYVSRDELSKTIQLILANKRG
jgi:hypothetical protein